MSDKPVPDSRIVRTNILTLQRLYDLTETDLEVIAEYFMWWMENQTTYHNTNRAWNKFVESHVYVTAAERIAEIPERRACWLRAVDNIQQKVVEGYPN